MEERGWQVIRDVRMRVGGVILCDTIAKFVVQGGLRVKDPCLSIDSHLQCGDVLALDQQSHTQVIAIGIHHRTDIERDGLTVFHVAGGRSCRLQRKPLQVAIPPHLKPVSACRIRSGELIGRSIELAYLKKLLRSGNLRSSNPRKQEKGCHERGGTHRMTQR